MPSGAKNIAASEKTRSVRRLLGGQIAIPVLVVALSAFGVLMVYSASFYAAETVYGDKFYFMKKQLVGFIIGIGAMAAASLFPYRKLLKLKWPALIISLVLLAAVFIPGVGRESYGATRWIGLGPITIQPSEIAKYGFVIFAAAYASENPERMKKFVGMLPVLAAGGGICLLVILEPNMSITMCIGLLMVAMLFLSGVKIRHFLVILIPVVAAVPVLIAIEPYRLKRLYAFIDPWQSPQGEGYQLIQSLYALGNGGWLGVGLFNSRQKYRFLPFAESDFILSVIGEEFGFVGILLLFAAAGALIWFGIRTAARSRDLFGFLVASGITLVYAIQVVVNALVVSGSIPPTGLPLPLISSGNTSLIFTMAAMGVLYNISKSAKRAPERAGGFAEKRRAGAP